MSNRPKKFEEKFREQWYEIDNTLCIRLPDQQSGYFGTSSNISDFICYKYPVMYILELKSHEGNTFPFSAFRQYSKMKELPKVRGVEIGVILWFVDHDKILYIPLSTFEKLEMDGKKSFNIKYVGEDEYFSLEIPSVKMRTFMKSDYSILINYAREKQEEK